MALSIAKGLAFLHTDIQKGGMWIKLWVRLALSGLLTNIYVCAYFPEGGTMDINQNFLVLTSSSKKLHPLKLELIYLMKG